MSRHKSVSTEDLHIYTINNYKGFLRLEAILNTLVDNKIGSMKNGKVEFTSSENLKSKVHSQNIASTSAVSLKTLNDTSHSSCSKASPKKLIIRNGNVRKKYADLGHSNKSRRCKNVVLKKSKHFPEEKNTAIVLMVDCNCEREYTASNAENESFRALEYDTVYTKYSANLSEYTLKSTYKKNDSNIEDYNNVDVEVVLKRNLLPRVKKTSRKKQKSYITTLTTNENLKIFDPDELSQRARWTIVATACLLLSMCLLLVGITLRMAPIIDDMIRKENEELMNSSFREYSERNLKKINVTFN